MANATAPNPTRPPGPDGGAAPLLPVLVFVGLNSLGTGAVQTGVFFLLREAYGFSAGANFVFGVFLYASYIVGALAVGPLLRRWTSPERARVSARGVLLALVLVQAGLSLLPRTASWLGGGGAPGVWVMWTVGLGFGVLTGMMWPIVESFLSGGRRGRTLSAATGKFNIVWSAAVVAAFWLMAPLLDGRPLEVLTGLAVFQAGSALCLRWFPRKPGRFLESAPEPHPAHWARLLRWFRVLLPVGYVLCGTISPLLPSVIGRLGVDTGWMTPVASAWVTSRVVVFAVFERWHGWHGRWWMPVLAGGGLVGGFIATVAAPGWVASHAGSGTGVAVLIGALLLFGTGHATAYVGALYYAMELGDAEVEAGGTHEALIGVGYGVGPVLGLGAVGIAGAQSGAAFEIWLIVLALGVTGLALTAATRQRPSRI